MEPTETEIHVCVETEIADEECLSVDEQKALMIRNETESIYFSRSKSKEIVRSN